LTYYLLSTNGKITTVFLSNQAIGLYHRVVDADLTQDQLNYILQYYPDVRVFNNQLDANLAMLDYYWNSSEISNPSATVLGES